MATEKTVKIRKDRKCDCCGKLHKNGTVMLFGEWKDAKFDKDENQIGIEYHRYYWCYDGTNPNWVNNNGLKIYSIPCG